MKTLISISVLSLVVACSGNSSDNHDEHHPDSSSVKQVKDTSKKSIPAEAYTTAGGASINIKYHSPAVRGRTIWGGLVPYGEVWVTGAHSATTLEVNKAFMVGGETIPAGKYALFTIPSKEEWTIIINRNWEQHLADDYNQSEDVVRVLARPVADTSITERLKYEIQPEGNNANITIRWEKISVSFAIEVK